MKKMLLALSLLFSLASSLSLSLSVPVVHAADDFSAITRSRPGDGQIKVKDVFYSQMTGNFSDQHFNQIVQGRTSVAFLKDVQESNPDSLSYPLFEIPIQGGKLFIQLDSYFYTKDEEGDIVAVFVDGRLDGILPSYAYDNEVLRKEDALLCFFKGERQGQCAVYKFDWSTELRN